MIDFLLLIVVALVGAVGHWLKRWARRQTDSSLKDYIMSNYRHSVMSGLSIVSSIIGLYMAGNIELNAQALSQAFMFGYMLDSTINKDKL